MRIITTFIILSMGLMAWGQKDAQEKIQAAKIALITERLNLSPEQAEKFWPVYNEYSQKLETVRRNFVQAKQNHNAQTATDEENKRLLELGMRTKEQSLQIEKQYSDRLLQVINNRQMLSLRKAEDDFKEMILRRLRDQQQKRDQMRDRIQNQRDNQRRRNN